MTMTDAPAPLSAAEQARIRRRKRRAAKVEIRDASFQALADGRTQEQIANARGVSVARVRREIHRAIAARQVRAPEAHAQVQIARITKALALLGIRLDRGEMAAIGPFLKTVAALDRYHRPIAPALTETPSPAAPQRLPAPPLALTHAAPPLAGGRTEAARDDAGKGSVRPAIDVTGV
jgi:hypothetical protein